MNFFKPVLLTVLLASLSGCGTSQAPAVNLGSGQYPYNNWNNNGGNWNNNGSNWGGWNTGLPGGGTKSIIPVISYSAYANASKQFMVSPTVEPMDQIEVQAAGGQVVGQGAFGYTNMIWLTKLDVKLNGGSLGSSTYAKYNVTQAGTLSLSFSASGLTGMFGNMAQYMVSFPYGGVWINRCRNASNQPIQCP
jgi:hypothetical protein